VHRQEAGSLIHGKPAVWSGLDLKVGHSSVFFIEKENVAKKGRAGTC
jgi:hypothetical protein